METDEIGLKAVSVTRGDLESLLREELKSTPLIELLCREPIHRVRGIDPAVLVALVGAGGTALGALIAGVLRIAEMKGRPNIVLVGGKGIRIEVPADTSSEALDEYIIKAKALDLMEIEI